MEADTRTMSEALRSASDDAAGFDLFVSAHYRRLVGLAALVAGDLEGAEDVVQTALERAWRRRTTLRSPDGLRPWLDRIVVREAARARRHRLRRLARLFLPRTATASGPYGQDVADRNASHFTERSALRMVVDGLSAPQRAVVVLHLHAGYSVDETAELLGVPRETVRSRLRLARARLRDALGEMT
jgi:RNA polymerase sigma-70 factor (ECF subfamily)